MSRILSFDCFAGISGDMTVAALLDLGADEKKLREGIYSLPLSGYHIDVSRVTKAALDCCDFAVVLEGQDNHDHDMDYLHGEHHHEETSSHGHTHRGMREIREIIGAGNVTDGARVLALRIFEILARAEARAHGTGVDQVHFHEVGAVDSIVDIVAAAICLDDLHIDRVVIPYLAEGSGTVRCQHGVLPIPVPAVAGIVSTYDLPLKMTEIRGELVTPTGAAIAAALEPARNMPEDVRLLACGYGAGKRTYERPSILRAMLWEQCDPGQSTDEAQGIAGKESNRSMESVGETLETWEQDRVWKLEANIDDMTGEHLGLVVERLMDSGARDVYYTPIYMKKNRPAYLLGVLVDEETLPRIEELIFEETTTIGIRRCLMQRSILARKQAVVCTPWGEARVKLCETAHSRKCYPEYESVKELSQKADMSYREMYMEIVSRYQG